MRHKNELLTAIVCIVLLIGVLIIGACSDVRATEAPIVQETPKPIVDTMPQKAINNSALSKPKPKPCTNEPIEEEPIIEFNYTDDEVMCITNMVYGEISVITYDNSYTKEEQDLAMQEWARIPINHVAMGTMGDNVHDVICAKSGKYYIWHPKYATEWYMNQCIAENADLYERCRTNVIIALSDCMTNPVPETVIYADLRIHGGGAYKTYYINTGYYSSTVYLSYKE